MPQLTTDDQAEGDGGMRKRGKGKFVFNKFTSLGTGAGDVPSQGDMPQLQNRVLLEWLCDDDDRTALYGTLAQAEGLPFWSRTRFEDDPAPSRAQAPEQGPRRAVLVTDRKLIESILRDGTNYSNRAYRALGGGGFMLGLDPDAARPACPHAAQRKEGIDRLAAISAGHYDSLAERAVRDALVLPLTQRDFDLADVAQQIALRWCGLVFGFATSDHALLQDASVKAYRGITYQIIGRHFVSEPDTLPAAEAALARLARRADELMREYDRLRRYPTTHPSLYAPRPERDNWPEGVPIPTLPGLSGFAPLLRVWARHPGQMSGEQLATMAAGMIAGTIGNVQAAICIVVDHVLNFKAGGGGPNWKDALLAAQSGKKTPEDRLKAMRSLVEGWTADALRENPPVAFLPRIVATGTVTIAGHSLSAGTDLVLCLGAATRHGAAGSPPWDPLTFGLSFGLPGAQAQATHGVHACIAAEPAMKLVEAAVMRILTLPDLAQRLDPVTREPLRLEKRWGFACERYPLRYRRDRHMAQQPLQVVMRIRSPVAENAALLRRAIVDSAPRVQQVLEESRHVHFAWFQLLDGDTQLALQTVYDGDFDSYLMHFALKVDDVFDSLFRFLEDAPPLPVREHPEAFVEAMRRYNRAPLAGYFFSAYPRFEAFELLRLAKKAKP